MCQTVRSRVVESEPPVPPSNLQCGNHADPPTLAYPLVQTSQSQTHRLLQISHRSAQHLLNKATNQIFPGKVNQEFPLRSLPAPLLPDPVKTVLLFHSDHCWVEWPSFCCSAKYCDRSLQIPDLTTSPSPPSPCRTYSPLLILSVLQANPHYTTGYRIFNKLKAVAQRKKERRRRRKRRRRKRRRRRTVAYA